MDTIRYLLAVLIWATFPPAVFFWYMVHPFIGYWRRVGGPVQTYLVVGPVCVLMMGALVRWNPVAGTDLGMNVPLFALGFGLYVCSWAIERKVRKFLDFKTLAGVPELKFEATPTPRIPTTIDEYIGEDSGDDASRSGADAAATGPTVEASDPRGRLLQEGIYARVRHPRYLAVMAGLLGWAMMSNYGTSYAIAVLLIPALLGVIHFEEKELVDRFGEDYLEYRKRVPAVLPRLG